jgi:hypothetical protein
MEGFATVSKPNLIEPNVMMYLEMKKNMVQTGGATESRCSQIWTKFTNDFFSFLHNNFWVLLIIVFFSYLLWKRYKWYQIKHYQQQQDKLKKKKELEKSRKLKLYMAMQQEKLRELKQREKKKAVSQALQASKEQPFGTYDGNVYASF